MSILNYTTQIEATKSIGEIMGLLTSHKASAIMTDYAPDGSPKRLSFRINTEFGVMTFMMPARIDRVLAVMQRDRRVAPQLKTREQATRVAWRIIKDGIAAQLAWVQCGLVTIDAVFLAYAQNEQGETVYDRLIADRMQGLALPAPK